MQTSKIRLRTGFLNFYGLSGDASHWIEKNPATDPILLLLFFYCRHLDHKNVVKFFGAMKVNISYQSKEHKFVFVRTFCQANLRSVIFNDKSVTPAQASNIIQAIDAFLKWAIEIADGLNYIHERGLVHRHLRLGNILVCINLTSSLDFYSSVREPWPLSDLSISSL